MSGEVVVRARGEGAAASDLRTMGPRSYFGEIGLLRGVPRTATVVTTEPTVLWRLSAADFQTALETGQPSASLLGVAGTRLARTHPLLAAQAPDRPPAGTTR